MGFIEFFIQFLKNIGFLIAGIIILIVGVLTIFFTVFYYGFNLIGIVIGIFLAILGIAMIGYAYKGRRH